MKKITLIIIIVLVAADITIFAKENMALDPAKILPVSVIKEKKDKNLASKDFVV